MKARELRIGNWVNHKSEYSYRQPEQDFKDFSFQWEENDWYQIGECLLSLENIEPIPLTEEWLIKFGFNEMYTRKGYFIKPLNLDGKMTLDSEDFIFNLKSGYIYVDFGELVSQIGIPIIYVHEFQNAYFALTGEELL